MNEIKISVIWFFLINAVTFLFWIFVGRWSMHNRRKIPGRLFEYLFFLFLFFASYYLTWSSSGILEGMKLFSRLALMFSCIISAIFTGYLYYIKKIYN
ncbi:MAG TPA: hypothetical protein ENI33_00300 [Thermoplasmatales archaeon]|nr:hypothetical protein [Thermoplasmatales archaeon]